MSIFGILYFSPVLLSEIMTFSNDSGRSQKNKSQVS